MFENTRLEHLLEQPAVTPVNVEQPAPYSLPHLINWLAAHDQSETYNWESHQVCLLGQYQTAVGRPAAGGYSPFTHALANFGASVHREIGLSVHSKLSQAAYEIASGHPHTFGAALARAKAVEAIWASA